MFAKGLLPLVVAGCVLLLAGSLLPGATAIAVPPGQVAPATVPYAGRLADAAGQPVADGVYAFRFVLYAEPDAGDPLWSETVEGVVVTGGEFATTLGTTAALPAALPNGGKVWLAVAVRGPGEGDFTELFPRAPVAVEAKDETVTISAVDAATCPHTHWHESWTGTRNDYALLIDNNGAGDGLRVYSSATATNYAALYGVIEGNGIGSGVYGRSTKGYGVYGLSTDGAAVYGSSTNGVGVSGISTKSDGIKGEAATTDKSGVYGFNSANGYGVFGRSTSRFGLGAAGAGDGSGTDAVGDLLLTGARGEIFADGSFLNLYSNFNVNVDLDNDNNDTNACLQIWKGDETLAGQTCENGTKSAILATESYGTRAVYAVESPEVWLEDFGSATLTNGVAVVTIDPIFGEMISTDGYHVFVTPLGDCKGLYVEEKNATGYTVQELGGGGANIGFDYRLVAKRIGLEDLRMEVIDVAAAREMK